MSIMAGLLIVLITGFRLVAINRLPKGVFVLLWMVALVRLLFPINISLEPLFNQLGWLQPNVASSYSMLQAGEVVQGGGGLELSNTPEFLGWMENMQSHIAQLDAILIDQGSWVIAIWLIGMAIVASVLLIKFMRGRRVLAMALPIDGMILYTKRRRHAVQVYTSDRITTPLTHGVFRPRIVLPKSIQFGNRAHYHYVIRHEMTHIERHDMLLKLLMLVAICVHWFNPLVWLMYVLACRDIELRCDEQVLSLSRKDRRKDYALTLIRMEETRSVPLPLHAAFGKTAIEERVLSIMKFKKASFPGVIAAVLAVCMSMFVFCGGAKAPETITMPHVAIAITSSEDGASDYQVGDLTATTRPDLYIVKPANTISADESLYHIGTSVPMSLTYDIVDRAGSAEQVPDSMLLVKDVASGVPADQSFSIVQHTDYEDSDTHEISITAWDDAAYALYEAATPVVAQFGTTSSIDGSIAGATSALSTVRLTNTDAAYYTVSMSSETTQALGEDLVQIDAIDVNEMPLLMETTEVILPYPATY
ncbi:M56 family metallopeptidase [Eubacteriales bacterium OttesenSCG-928-N13]|nr:M56 family metallopeptidase [Eubacteriales bacterium OttesenSCG-928-N13]